MAKWQKRIFQLANALLCTSLLIKIYSKYKEEIFGELEIGFILGQEDGSYCYKQETRFRLSRLLNHKDNGGITQIIQ